MSATVQDRHIFRPTVDNDDTHWLVELKQQKSNTVIFFWQHVAMKSITLF